MALRAADGAHTNGLLIEVGRVYSRPASSVLISTILWLL